MMAFEDRHEASETPKQPMGLLDRPRRHLHRRGGTAAGRHAHRPQAPVGEPGGLSRRRRPGHPRPARPCKRRANPRRPGRRGEDGHDRRDQCAAGAQGRPHACCSPPRVSATRCASATRRGRRFSPSTSSSRRCCSSRCSRSTSACSPTAPSSASWTSRRCAPSSSAPRPTASRRSPSCSCTPTAIRSMSSASPSSRAR